MKKIIMLSAVLLLLAGCTTMGPPPDPEPFATPHKLTDSLELISLGFGQAEGIGGIYPCVEGIVHNTSKDIISYVEVDIAYFDKQGNQIQTSFVNTTNLAPDGRWLFKDSIMYTGYHSFKLMNVLWN